MVLVTLFFSQTQNLQGQIAASWDYRLSNAIKVRLKICVEWSRWHSSPQNSSKIALWFSKIIMVWTSKQYFGKKHNELRQLRGDWGQLSFCLERTMAVAFLREKITLLISVLAISTHSLSKYKSRPSLCLQKLGTWGCHNNHKICYVIYSSGILNASLWDSHCHWYLKVSSKDRQN